jgi:predicted MFS family arabinose efflux permease
MTYLQLFIVLSLPVTGLCYATLGAIKLPLSKQIGLDEAKVGGLISTFGLMVGPIIILCGALSDTYGRKPVWMVGSLLVVVSFLIFANVKKYSVAVVATVLLAVGWTAMINVANPVMAGVHRFESWRCTLRRRRVFVSPADLDSACQSRIP